MSEPLFAGVSFFQACQLLGAGRGRLALITKPLKPGGHSTELPHDEKPIEGLLVGFSPQLPILKIS